VDAELIIMRLSNLLLTMDTQMWIWAEIDYQTMISCYFIDVLDTQMGLLQNHDRYGARRER